MLVPHQMLVGDRRSLPGKLPIALSILDRRRDERDRNKEGATAKDCPFQLSVNAACPCEALYDSLFKKL
ncbi:MAG TPA: hypothetical protein IGS17_20925 [Oscillatoriales cyanobacterium M59_W2019_021]|nr:hypothetical protein [Oscillatoriales cyanobacterium M4454_W2019_049]HIK53354.1 hypothetical protein [Oscillatoriales cyanobacterium M59_W2019_021]